MSDTTPPVPPAPEGASPQTPPAAAPVPPAAPQQPYGQPAPAQPVYGQQPYGQPVYGQPYAQPYPVGPRTNPLAIIALVLSLVGLVTGLPAIGGIICGHIALSQIKRTGEGGRGLALGGVIAGYIVAGFWVLLVIVYVIVFVAILGTAAATGYSSNY